jgi:hypothetical protein
MTAENSSYVGREPSRTVYVDTDDQAVALHVVVRVRQLSGEITRPTSTAPPKIDKRIANPNLLKNRREFEGLKFSVIAAKGRT